MRGSTVIIIFSVNVSHYLSITEHEYQLELRNGVSSVYLMKIRRASNLFSVLKNLNPPSR